MRYLENLNISKKNDKNVMDMRYPMIDYVSICCNSDGLG